MGVAVRSLSSAPAAETASMLEGDVESGEATRAFYHGLETDTQPPKVVSVQRQSGTIRGYPARGSRIPKVRAYGGRLPAGKRGIEFTTDVPPDGGGAPGLPTWSGPRFGVRAGVDDQGWDYVEIDVVVTENTQA